MKKCKILLVEDSLADQAIFKRTLEECQLDFQLETANGGAQALAVLERLNTPGHSLHPFPHLIFLDINMPELHGKTFLSVVKKSKRWNHIPVVMLSTSNREKDVQECLNYGATSYITKPASAEQLTHAILQALVN